jgi:hypothetical protein
MKIDKINAPMRFFIFVVASVIFIGIWLTGFATAHWLLYIPVIFFSFAAATGVCPGMNLSNKLFGKHNKETH